MNAQKKTYLADEELYSYDNHQKLVGIILSGQANVVRYEYNGTRTILEKLQYKSIFGETIDI
jgi:uncharacterized protein (UPF0297 family)